MFPQITPYLLSIIALLATNVLVLAQRQQFFLQIGIRNITRRKINTILIILGAMIGTTIITASFITGDTLDYSIKKEVYEQLGRADLAILRSTPNQRRNVNTLEETIFSHDLLNAIQLHLDSQTAIESAVPVLRFSVPVEHVDPNSLETILFEPQAQIIGTPITTMCAFLEQMDNCPDLQTNQAGLTVGLADKLDAAVGDLLAINFQGEQFLLEIGDIIDQPGLWQLSGDMRTASNLILNLEDAQRIFLTSQPAGLEIPDQLLSMLSDPDLKQAFMELQSEPPENFDDLPPLILDFLDQQGLTAVARSWFGGQTDNELTDPISRIYLACPGDIPNSYENCAPALEPLRTALAEYSATNKINLELRELKNCLLYTSPSPRDRTRSRMPSSA